MMKVKTKTKKKMIRQIRKIRLLIRLIDWLSLPQYGQMYGMDTVQFDNLLSRKALASCSLDELKIAYEELLHSQPPPRISADFLKGNIACIRVRFIKRPFAEMKEGPPFQVTKERLVVFVHVGAPNGCWSHQAPLDSSILFPNYFLS